MTADLELTVLHDQKGGVGYVGAFAITDQMIIAAGGTTSRAPTVLASSNARHFEARHTPRQLGLRDVLVVGDAWWTCGEYGQLAVSRDRGATWKMVETSTDACLFGLALASDGTVWVVGDAGYAGRVQGDRVERVDLAATVRLTAVYTLRDELVVLCGDGTIRRWRDGRVTSAATGSTRTLSGLAVTRSGTWVVVGDGGFVARSPDGAWFSRVKSGVEVDLESVVALADNRLVAIGDRGQILTSSDDGRTWPRLATPLTAHLWTIERFGGGALIGGDDGLIVKLAPPGDQTWHDHVNVFGTTKPLDAVFLRGPEDFIARGLAEYLEQRSGHGLRGSGERDGEATSFERTYGVAVPPEAARLRELTAGHAAAFAQLMLDEHWLPDIGEDNVFEQIVRRDQERHATGLVDAFCGVFRLGSQPSGNTYHLELYEWDGARQVLHFDRDKHAFTGVLADRLDSLAFLVALAKARETGAISDDAFAIAVRKLHGKVAPAGFSLGELEQGFVQLDPKRRDSEFLFYRSRWICALLENARIAEISALFEPDFNQVVPQEQLPARFDACEKMMPTALYAMWRAYLFDEPEIVPYLEIGRRHKARLVRDSARLIDELRSGRNELGSIGDMREHLAAFRALDLDPRRAEHRKAEPAPPERPPAPPPAPSAPPEPSAPAELSAPPEPSAPPIAWHELVSQLASLGELGVRDREHVVAQLANALSPELDEALADALASPPASNGDAAPGWDAIDRALAPVYGQREPHAHYGTVVPYMLGGNDPIHGISVYLRDEPVPHFHFITYGFTDLFSKETDDPDESGFGFELTFRLARSADDTAAPSWALNFLQNLGRYVFGTGNCFAAGHKMGLNGPIALGHDTKITAILFADDPELGDITSPFGAARFVQVVGITDDEYRLIQEWSTTGLADILRKKLPLLVTNLARGSVLDDAELAAETRARVAAEGSSEDMTFAGEMTIEAGDDHVHIEMGALYAAALPRAMRGRLRHGRPYLLRGHQATLQLEPGEQASWSGDDDELTLVLPTNIADEIEAKLRDGLAGDFHFDAWPVLHIVVTPSFIRDQAGKAIEVRGVADPAEAESMIAEENVRLEAGGDDDASAEQVDEDEVLDEQDELDEDDNEDDDDEARPDPSRVRAALAMTERAMRLAPGDDDVQFTHAMLLVDADRVGIDGKLDELIAQLPRFSASSRLNVASRLGKLGHERFGDALDVVLAAPLPGHFLAESSGGMVASFGDVATEVLSGLGTAILEHAPDRMPRFTHALPDEVDLLAQLAGKAVLAEQREVALELYERVLAQPIPDEGASRRYYLASLNDACVLAHMLKAYDRATQIADRAQPVAHENPYIYHAAACAYAAVGDYAKAFEQVKLAVAHDYNQLPRVEVDADLGPILDWPEFKELFRDWRARQEGN